MYEFRKSDAHCATDVVLENVFIRFRYFLDECELFTNKKMFDSFPVNKLCFSKKKFRKFLLLCWLWKVILHMIYISVYSFAEDLILNSTAPIFLPKNSSHPILPRPSIFIYHSSLYISCWPSEMKIVLFNFFFYFHKSQKYNVKNEKKWDAFSSFVYRNTWNESSDYRMQRQQDWWFCVG